MVGHSMGGALAAKSANHLLTLPIGDKVQGNFYKFMKA